MQFKHPEILYALLLLLIPIFVHLFQLRRFQKIDFTNVAFLKKATLQTRKSSRLKKWLTLLTRLLALACIIFAFAQPFSASKKALNTEKETVLYIDNSFSMEVKGSNGPMLKKVVQDIYENVNGDMKLSWFTNDESKKNVSQTDLKNEVLSLKYSQNQMDLQDVLLKAQQLFSKSTTADKKLILVSDFQQKGSFPAVDSTFSINVVQTKPVVTANLAIDTAYIISKNANNIQLQVTVSKTGELPETASISLLNDGKLIAKTAVDFSESTKNTIVFDIENTQNFIGEIQMDDTQLSYDNSLFFSINYKEKIKVLSINQSNSDFLRKLFDNEGYDYVQQEFNQLNFSVIPSQNFIVLNELKSIPASLTTTLREFSNQGGSIFIIPAKDLDIASYNLLLNTLQVGTINGDAISAEKKIAKINFSHPLYTNVFEKRVTNFQFPSVQSFFQMTSNASKVLSFEDDKPFLLQTGNTFVTTAAFNQQNSNFKTSPLIVPTLINMAQQSLSLPKLYFDAGKLNTFAIPEKLTQDEIVTLKDSISSFIPLQQTKANSVEITTENEPAKAGNYGVYQNEQLLQYISYNYPRTESRLTYANAEDWEGVETFSSVSDLFNSIAEENNTTSFWKWFVIFAVLFLLVEMFILKFFK
ncbi:BatA domain-containing protein [Aureisphaera sp. CAU 1614]|uniref:BatA domain-containing protein n=1 Tax=Halomarinibacterium sedimenti TaxID=2857106 RepID=A0A9X1JYY4_9FLAO|nr:BatA domain-containing protein [Halomarinibacterium sedimenti]MBW2937997.1 BatA domain-containing protein [Halomarinibacterium sedimenti]